jgi:hypothetical protein
VAFGHVPTVTSLNPVMRCPDVPGTTSAPMAANPDVPTANPVPVPAHPDIARTGGNTVGFHYRRRGRDGDHRAGVGHACRIDHARTQRYGQSRYDRRISHKNAPVAHKFPRHVVGRSAAFQQQVASIRTQHRLDGVQSRGLRTVSRPALAVSGGSGSDRVSPDAAAPTPTHTDGDDIAPPTRPPGCRCWLCSRCCVTQEIPVQSEQ